MPEQSSKPVSESQVTITELMIPSYANFGGKIHGGIILGLMDKVAYVCAAKHAGTYCVTVSVDTVDFLQPIEVGELVSLHASVNHVGNTSLVVGIRVTSENVEKGIVRHTNTSYFTMVAKNKDEKPAKVPELVLQNPTQIRRCLEAIKRKELKSRYKSELNDTKNSLSIEQELHLLEGGKCNIAPQALL